MSRKFIASIVMGALVAASLSAAPARADDRDTARAIAGIAALVLLGKAISDRNDDRRDQHSYHAKPQNQHGHGVRRPVRLDPKPLPQRVRKMTLPQRCLTTVQTRRDTLRYMNGRCLQNNYRWSESLPRACEIRVKGPRRVRTGYQAGCLKRNGYRLNG